MNYNSAPHKQERSVQDFIEMEEDAAKDASEEAKPTMLAPGHKIRNLDEKISRLGSDSQLVQAVYKRFCVPKIEELNRDQTELWDQLKVVISMEKNDDKKKKI